METPKPASPNMPLYSVALYLVVGVAAIAVVVQIILAITGPPPGGEAGAPPAEQETAVSETTEPEAELTVVSWKLARDELGGWCIRGVARNDSDRTLEYAEVDFNLYDKSGAQIESTMTNINNLEPHALWKFEAGIMSDKVAAAKFKGASGS